jgi:hypothetical protein
LGHRKERAAMTTVSMGGSRNLRATATLHPDGSLEFEGQDFSGFAGASEYEYSLKVSAADVPRVEAALGAKPGDDILALLRQNAEMIIRTGEQKWLRSLGIEPKFWSHFG